MHVTYAIRGRQHGRRHETGQRHARRCIPILLHSRNLLSFLCLLKF